MIYECVCVYSNDYGLVIMRKHCFVESNLKDEFSYYKDKGRVCLWFLYTFFMWKVLWKKNYLQCTFNVEAADALLCTIFAGWFVTVRSNYYTMIHHLCCGLKWVQIKLERRCVPIKNYRRRLGECCDLNDLVSCAMDFHLSCRFPSTNECFQLEVKIKCLRLPSAE